MLISDSKASMCMREQTAFLLLSSRSSGSSPNSRIPLFTQRN